MNFVFNVEIVIDSLPWLFPNFGFNVYPLSCVCLFLVHVAYHIPIHVPHTGKTCVPGNTEPASSTN